MITSVARTKITYDLSNDGVQTLEETWMAESDSMYEYPPDVLASGELAARTWYGGHPSDPTLKCRAMKCDQQSDLNIWVVTLTYTDLFEPFDRTVTPNDRPWHMDWGAASSERVLEKDYTTPTALDVANTAGIPYDPPPMTQDAIAVLNVTLYREAANPTKITDYLNAVNDDDWTLPDGTVLAADTARCVSYEQTQTQEQLWGIIYQYRLSFHVKTNPKWNPVRILDAGTMQINESFDPPRLEAIVELKSGSPVTSPVPLDGTGHRLDYGANFWYNEFVGFPRKDFDTIIAG